MSMQIVYAREEFPKKVTKSVFLAGPTLRSGHPEEMYSWRDDAIKYFKELEYDGVLYIPEARDGKYSDHYNDQVEWEEEALNYSDIIIFWVPRDLEFLPGFTTNDEWGSWKKFGKVIFGAPEDAEKVRYQLHHANKNNIKTFTDLKDVCVHTIDRLGEGVLRTGNSIKIPMEYFNHPGFMSWYKDLKDSGNDIEDFKALFEWRIAHANNMLFSFAFWCKVYIKEEDRYKENEYVLTRTNISSCVLYKPNEDILETDIVLIKEFRSPVSNSESFVYEIPGGSSFKPEKDMEQVVLEEVMEETGISIDKSKLSKVSNRQLQSTSLSHKCFLYKVELDDKDLINILKNVNKTFGVEEDSERTYLKVYKLKNLLNKDIVDYSNLGMIFEAICNVSK